MIDHGCLTETPMKYSLENLFLGRFCFQVPAASRFINTVGLDPAPYGVKTHCEFVNRIGTFPSVAPVNAVARRIFELGSFQLAQRKKYICAVRRKVVIPNRRYSWMLFEYPTDTDPVEVVVLDVNLAQAIQIDRGLGETFQSTLLLAITEKNTSHN
jgi:hypothetical protein